MLRLRFTPAGRLRAALYWCSGPLIALAVAGCGTAPAGTAPSATPAALTSPVASPSPAASQAGAAPTPALPPAIIDVSPSQVQVGAVTLSLAFEPARHMQAQTVVMATDPDPAHQPGGAGQASSAVVLDGLLRLTNNIDPSQPAPADLPQVMLRHVSLQVRTNADTQPVPYLSVSMDILLDGHPAAANVGVVPMLAAEATPPRLYYGNNLKLMQRGTYQVFVRLQPNALLGKDQPQAAQFNLVVR